MNDMHGRKINYMRVSVTDRCDLRCRYCMPEGCDKVPMSQILTYEELPGSPRAVRECLEFLMEPLEHGLEIMLGRGGECARG